MDLDKIGEGTRWIDQLVRFYAKIVESPLLPTENLDKANDAILECIEKLRPLTHQIFKCDSLCIHYMEKDCHTEDEENGMCDQPDKYREVGDVADRLKQEHEDKLWEGSESNPKNRAE